MVQHPPFPGQSNYTEFQQFLDEKLANVTEEVGSPREVVQRRRDIVNSGLADWKLHFELAALGRNLRDQRAMYHHLNRLFELYPHNHESFMNLAELLSRDGKWREVIPYLERSDQSGTLNSNPRDRKRHPEDSSDIFFKAGDCLL